uniref:ShKT domain-containing protein n=1 Tax=Ascaris lumbricoides TaxID=6252 RepID=A0A9J2Q2B0_ASCLU
MVPDVSTNWKTVTPIRCFVRLTGIRRCVEKHAEFVLHQVCFDKAGKECENYTDLCHLPYLKEICAKTCNSCITTTVTTTAAPIPLAPTATTRPCVDRINDCRNGSLFCGTNWYDNICTKTCNACSQPRACADSYWWCSQGSLLCGTGWYNNLCQKTCGVCKEPEACDDILSNCADGSIFCSRPWYMSVCGKSCGRCGSQPPGKSHGDCGPLEKCERRNNTCVPNNTGNDL